MNTRKRVKKSNKESAAASTTPFWWFDEIDSKVRRMSQATFRHDLAWESLVSAAALDEERALEILKKYYGPLSFVQLYVVLSKSYSYLSPPPVPHD